MGTQRAGSIWLASWPRGTDLGELARPRLVALGLAVVGCGYLIAAPSLDAAVLAWTLLGSLLALSGASALNQALEGRVDGHMRRTAARPIPQGRVSPSAAALYGLLLTGTGVAILAVFVYPITAVVTALGWLVYVLLYTPLKAHTPWAVAVGAVPGAVPALIGWSAATGELTAGAWALFAIMALWQLPHFLAIGWMYRADYARAGLRLLPEGDGAEALVARRAVVSCAVLVPVSLLPWTAGVADRGGLAVVAALLGAGYLERCLRLRRERTGRAARDVVKASVLYLPALLALLVLDSRFW